MTFEENILEIIVDQFRRCIVIALYLVANDVHLVFYFVLGILAAEDNIRQQVDSAGKVFLLDSRIKHGVFFIGEGIQVSTDTLQAIEYLDSGTAMSALETHVFAKMGYALFASLFVA